LYIRYKIYSLKYIVFFKNPPNRFKFLKEVMMGGELGASLSFLLGTLIIIYDGILATIKTLLC
jgi:hypothetical protein